MLYRVVGGWWCLLRLRTRRKFFSPYYSSSLGLYTLLVTIALSLLYNGCGVLHNRGG